MSIEEQLASVTLENRLRKEAHARLVAVLPKGDCLPAHEQVAALVNAIKGIRSNPAGCPMCNNGGTIINPGKEHWDDCPYLAADKAISVEMPESHDTDEPIPDSDLADMMDAGVVRSRTVEIAPGVMANVSPDVKPETIGALQAMAKAATKRPAADLIADHFGFRVLRDEPLKPGDTMIHDGQISVVLRKLAPTSNA